VKILFLINTLASGGKERQLLELIKGLKTNKDIECELVLFSHNVYYHEIHKLGIKIHFFHKSEDSFSPNIYRLFKVCREIKPDIIHTWGFRQTRIALPIAKLLKIKLINGSIRYAKPVKKFSKLWWNAKLTFPFSDMVVANSKAGLGTHNLKESYSHRYVYNGFNFDRINKQFSSSLKAGTNFGSNFVVGVVANFAEGKDHETVVKAGLKILEKREDISFVFVGDGSNRPIIENLIKKKFKNHFRFFGRREDVEEIISIIDIGVLLAKKGHAEGISNTVMEYMALEKPVIVTDVGGNRELIIDGVTGFLIPHHDTQTLIDKLIFLIDNPDIREEMGRKGVERINKYFEVNKMISNYVDIYNQMVKLH
jgi:glycosyltransferase involved in cell wall biosynthesis